MAGFAGAQGLKLEPLRGRKERAQVALVAVVSFCRKLPSLEGTLPGLCIKRTILYHQIQELVELKGLP